MASLKCETHDERSRKKPKHDEDTNTTTMSRIESLPYDLLLCILSKLPLSSLVKFKSVCRAWRLLFPDPHLVHYLFQNRSTEENKCLLSYFLYDKLSLVDFHSSYAEEEASVKKIRMPYGSPMATGLNLEGSYNDMLLFSDALTTDLYMYNPFTGEYWELPHYDHYPRICETFGIGLDPRTKKYKVVKMMYHCYEEGKDFRGLQRPFLESIVLIYTWGSSSWRSLGEISEYLDPWPSTQVIVNGRLHWKTYYKLFGPTHFTSRIAISFDLEDEQFREVPIPDSLELSTLDYFVELRGYLSAVQYVSDNHSLDIWVMKEYDVKESWIKEFSIGNFVPKAVKDFENPSKQDFWLLYGRCNFCRIVCIVSKNGEILMEYNSGVLALYNPSTRKLKELTIQELPYLSRSVVHSGILNKIDALTGVWYANKIRLY